MPTKTRNIIIILIIGLILFLCFRNKESNHTTTQSKPSYIHQSSTHKPNLNPNPSSYIYSHKSQNESQYNRDEIFKRSVKGYREYTYWGSEHPIQEKTRHLNDEEFNLFIRDEVESKDADLYWGVEY